MTQRIMTNTDIQGVTPVPKVFFKDVLGMLREAQVGWFGSLMRCRVQDRLGTVLEFPNIYPYATTDTTVDLLEVVSQSFYGRAWVDSRMLNISDTHNMVADIPATKIPSYKPQAYMQAEASTVEDVEQSPSSVIQRELTRYVEKNIDILFESAEELYFEDGMETDFSRELVSLVKKYGNLAMGEIGYLVIYARVDEEVISEALRWLARTNDPSTYGWRLWILEKSLSSKSPSVRDSAALGLVFMRDAHAIPYIKKAIEQETITELRYDLQGALKELEASLDAIPATGNKQA
jgi:hypothetical protein